ncbi:MAG: DUF3048 domain-containing protein [Candidatus Fimenecus sp.]
MKGIPMRNNFTKRIFAALMGAVLVILLFSACGKAEEPIEPVPSETETATTAQNSNVNPLTGLAVRAEAIGKRPVAVMVENSPQARPQWGLSSPDVVIEGVAEGGITRMMWLYADAADMPKVGPTRSARHDYVELAEGFDAIYVHFGGSVYAYDTLQKDGVDDIDGTKADGKYFARDNSRNVAVEHTAYTTGENIQKAISEKGLRTEVNAANAYPFAFADTKQTLSGGTCQSVLAVFSGDYKHTFKYNAADGLYYNYMNSKEMKDADGTTMAVSNVLILYTNISNVAGSDKGHVDWDLNGGNGVYVSNGTYQNIKWSKGTASTPTAPLKLTDESGNELKLNTGKMWIGFVPASNSSATVIG